MTDKFFCPRAIENGGGPDSPFLAPFNGEATWRDDGTCSYCGSLSPDLFFAAVADGFEVGPTDKSYKAYIDTPNPDMGKQVFKSSSSGPVFNRDGSRNEHAPDDLTPEELEAGRYSRKTYGPAEAVRHSKFYFQHLSDDERQRFVELLNAKTMKVGYPGRFYVRPFFCVPATA